MQGGAPISDTEHFPPSTHTSEGKPKFHRHAQTGMDFAMDQTGILVLSLRKGREFDGEDVTKHIHSIRKWVERKMRRTEVMGLRPMPDMGAFSIYHDDEADLIITRFRVTVGWADEFLCYAHTFSTDTHVHVEEALIAVPIPDESQGMVH